MKIYTWARVQPGSVTFVQRFGRVSQRVIRHLRKRGYLEASLHDVVPTGYDPASDEDPECARTMAASVQQRIAFGERAGQRGRRIGSGFGDEGETPTLTGPRGASLGGFSLHVNTSCVTAAAWRRTASCERRSSQRHASRERTSPKPPLPCRTGRGRDCSAGVCD